ncbi:MAG: hypothetical protein J6S67_07785 [Methanobrevibacter sp.]|nr:hypothetical protein [Methanobrevibacter sp.]
MATVRINTGGSSKKDELVPVVNKDDVMLSKKPLSSKFADAFISDSAKDVKDYIVMDVIIPGIKDTIINCLEMIFFGSTTGRGRSSRITRLNSENTSYRAFYQSDYDSYGAPRRRERRDRYRDDGYSDRIDYRNIVVRDRGSAEEIVSKLRGRIEKYGEATKSDLFELIDIPSSHVDNNWGWTDPRDIGIRRVASGYLIDVADAVYLEG